MSENGNHIIFACISVFLIAMVASCGPSVRPSTPEEPPTAELSPDEQNNLAMVDFEDILDMTTENKKRDIVPQLEEKYNGIIRKYPDSHIAQESYWRLVELNLMEQFPPKMDRAEEFRNEFIERYPDSRMILPIDDSMARFYYRNKEWERLLNVMTIHIREFLKTDKLNGPLFMFYYSEAKYNLKDYVEARKGYRIVAQRYPSSLEAKVSKQRIKLIDAAEKKNGN